MNSFLLKLLGTKPLNQVNELWCAICHKSEGCGCLVDVKGASVIVGGGIAIEILLEQCPVYSILENVSGQCRVFGE